LYYAILYYARLCPIYQENPVSLERWAEGPFELILHAELLYRRGGGFNGRMALISFDNAIEVSITTYLSLNPLLRKNRHYPKSDVERWLVNFHSKIDFLLSECSNWKVSVLVDKTKFVWLHDIRNDQYHGGTPTVPDERDLKAIRDAALWVFGTLYDVPDVEQILEDKVRELTSDDKPERADALDKLLDDHFGVMEFSFGADEDNYAAYASDLLYSHDPVAYQDIALKLLAKRKGKPDEQL
jgi:hypothetical protein